MIGILMFVILGGVAGVFLYSAYAGLAWTYRGVTIGGTGGGIGSYLVVGYTKEYIWLERGWSGESWGGLVLLIGLVVFVSVLLWNLCVTGGRTGIR